jgi:hypothetical protein
MTALGFTGTRSTKGHDIELKNYLESAEMIMYLRKFDTYVTGACEGWDALVGEFLALKFPPPIAQHIVIVPADKSRVDPWWEKFDIGLVQVVYMPDDTDYRDRNKEIVRLADQVFYCADYPEDDGRSKRSGTWMTKRIAEAEKVPVSGIVINKETQ